MTARRVAIGLSVLAVVLAGAPVPASGAEQVVGSPGISVYSPDNEFTPGQEATLPVYISNNGNLRQGGPAEYVERVTTARGLTVEVLDRNAPIEVNTGRYPVGRVPEGTTGPIPVSITIPEDARPGTYDVPVRVQYSYTVLVDYSSDTPEYNNGFQNRLYELTIRIRDRPRFEIVDTESTARIGGRGNTSITVRNVGTEAARDATLEITSSSDEIRFGTRSVSSRAFADVWEPGATRSFQFSTSVSSDAVVREYPLAVAVAYEDQDGILRTAKSLTTGIVPLEEQTFAVESLSSSLYVGEPGTVRGAVVNTGQVTARDAVLVYTSSSPNIDPVDAEVSLGTLAPGERSDFSFQVDVDEGASASRQQLNLTVRYRDPEGNRQVSDAIEPTVALSPEREWLEVTPERTTFAIDTDNRMTVRIRNTENESLTDLRARLTTDDPFSTESRVAYVERLDPGETERLAFGVTVAEEAVATQSWVSINVTAERPDGEDIDVGTYVVPVTVAADTGASDTTLVAAGALAVVVALLGGWWWLRR